MKEIGKMELKKVKEYFIIKMEIDMKVNLKMEYKKEKVFIIIIRMVIDEKVIGKMEIK